MSVVSFPHSGYLFASQIENSRFQQNIDIPRNIRAKLGGSPEYWGESRNIAVISEGVGCCKIRIPAKLPKWHNR